MMDFPIGASGSEAAGGFNLLLVNHQPPRRLARPWNIDMSMRRPACGRSSIVAAINWVVRMR